MHRRVTVTDYLVGTGGWAYFNVPGKDPLEAYSQLFNFTEVNYTFYEYPNDRQVEGWRRKVPASFTFGVRCHQDLTHRIGLKPVDEAYEVLVKMIGYCGRLRSPFLVLETPASYVIESETANQAREFFSSANLHGVRLVWEMRAPVTEEASNLMQDFNIVHSVIFSKETPKGQSDVVYSRLFGKGKHNLYQFTDNELIDIDRKAVAAKPKTVALSFHGAECTAMLQGSKATSLQASSCRQHWQQVLTLQGQLLSEECKVSDVEYAAY
jgi:uncharacterized protein YecE (DUF72 family)